MIFDAIIDLFINLFVGLFDLLPIPGVPQQLITIKNVYIAIMTNYVMPILNFLFGHDAVVWILTTVITVFNLWINYKMFVWLYDKIRGGKSE